MRGVDSFPDMLRPELAKLPRIVYEFDSPDTRTGYMYPAMARTFRAVGTQFAAMFAYDMLQTASRNLGWQTHYLNLVYTPRKAASAIIAGEAMRRLPRMRSYGPYPANTTFGDFHIAPDSNLGELVARDAFMYAGATRATPPDPAALRRIVGFESSPIVTYDGQGIYFLDKVRAGLWRLEVYPDAVPVRDPFEPPSPDKIVTRAISRPWPMTVALPDLDASFAVQPITAGNSSTTRASAGRFTVTPGVYVLSAAGPVDVATLPQSVGAVGFAEYHAPPLDTLAPMVHSLAAPEYVAGRAATLTARVVDATPPDSVKVFMRSVPGFYRGFAMAPASGYEYAATLPAAALVEGPHEFVITLFRGGSALTFPGGAQQSPSDWNYDATDAWKVRVVGERTPLVLFDAASDALRLTFTRIGDAGRRGLFHLGWSGVTGQAVFHFELPVSASGWSSSDYTASLVIKRRIAARQETITRADQLRLRVRGLAPHQVLQVTLMEDDGTSWTAPVTVDSTWSEQVVPLAAFTIGRGVLLPQGFPGEWNYWVGPAAGRGGSADRPRLDHVERLQLSLRAKGGVEVEWIALTWR